MQLAIVNFKARFRLDRLPYHGQPHLSGRRGLVLLVGRTGRDDENHFLQIKRLTGFARENEMSVVNRIECPAVNTDLLHEFSNPGSAIKQIRLSCTAEISHIVIPSRDNACR